MPNKILRVEISPVLGDIHTEKRETDGKYLVCSYNEVLNEFWLYSDALRFVVNHMKWARKFA